MNTPTLTRPQETAMRFQTTKKALISVLTPLARIIPAKSSNPALSAVHARVEDQEMTLTGTNQEVDLRLRVPVEAPLTGAAGTFLVNVHLLFIAVSKCAEEVLEFEMDGQTLHLRSGRGHIKLQCAADPSDFPALTFPAEGVSIDAGALRHSLQTVLYASSKEAFQTVFRGVNVELGSEFCRTVASNGYQVATREFPGLSGLPSDASVIIPRRNVEVLISQLIEEQPTQLHLGDGIITLTGPAWQLNVKLMDGDFPDWQRVVPKSWVLRFTTPVTELVKALDRVSFLADKNANNRVDFRVADGEVRVTTQGNLGESEDRVTVTHDGSEPTLSFGVNSVYLLQALKGMTGDVSIALAGSTNPLLITCTGDAAQYAVLVTLRV